MRSSDIIRTSFQNLMRTKFRSYLTISGVVIGISAIVMFVSMGIGLQKITSDQIASLDSLTTITVTRTQQTATMEEGNPLTDNLVSEIKALPNVVGVSPSVNAPCNVAVNGSSTGAIVYGVDEQFAKLEISDLNSGSYLNNKNEAVISTSLASALSGDPNSLIGQELTVTVVRDALSDQQPQIKVTVKGIDSNETTGAIYVDLNNLYKVAGFSEYSAFKVKVNDRKNIDTVKDKIKSMGYQVTTIKDLIDQIDKFFLLVEIILGIISGIGLLVSSLGIINTMTISLLERTHEIGIMKAIGAKGGDIKRMFFTESAMIGFFGGTIGVGLAVFLGQLCNFILNWAIRQSGQHLNLFVTPMSFAGAMIGFSIMISMMAGLYPARRAQRLPLIVALYQ